MSSSKDLQDFFHFTFLSWMKVEKMYCIVSISFTIIDVTDEQFGSIRSRKFN